MELAALDLSFLDVLAYKAGCMYLSDLQYIGDVQRMRLVYALERIPAEAVSLDEWNDAITYLTGTESPCSSAEQAKTELIKRLTAICE